MNIRKFMVASLAGFMFYVHSSVLYERVAMCVFDRASRMSHISCSIWPFGEHVRMQMRPFHADYSHIGVAIYIVGYFSEVASRRDRSGEKRHDRRQIDS